ncbi:MAG: class I fructose-bisphosphate aldolase [Candidatus Heimdallarchaeota archaeon]|nr:class I fructose-bisphosphate aldolase [Candidatus Heimdallarchaeota archaeon]
MSRVTEILSNYGHRNAGVRGKLSQIMNTGKLAGTGKMVILPVDQGFEHGPARSFAPNPAGYDPSYHVELALEAGCNAYAAPLGFIEAAANEFPGQIPLILKVNNNDSLYSTDNPMSAITSSIQDALELGVSGIGYTIYPGTAQKNENFGVLAEFIRQAHDVGLAAVIWSYARGEGLAKDHETALDIIAYNAHIAAQMGADIIKVKPPTDVIGLEAAKKSYENIKKDTLSDRISHVIQSAFNGERIVIFSGGPAKGTEAVLEEIKEIHSGGGFGSIMGRNAFQRSKSDAIELLSNVMEIYKS